MSHDWFIRVGEEIIGPLGSGEVRRLVREHSITRDTPIRRDDRVEFIPAGNVTGLFPRAKEDEATASWKRELGIPEGQGLFHEEPHTRDVQKARATAAFHRPRRRGRHP